MGCSTARRGALLRFPFLGVLAFPSSPIPSKPFWTRRLQFHHGRKGWIFLALVAHSEKKEMRIALDPGRYSFGCVGVAVYLFQSLVEELRIFRPSMIDKIKNPSSRLIETGLSAQHFACSVQPDGSNDRHHRWKKNEWIHIKMRSRSFGAL